MRDDEIERELRWAREALVIAKEEKAAPEFASGKNEILVGKIRRAGFHHLCSMDAEMLERHIERLERDRGSLGEKNPFDE